MLYSSLEGITYARRTSKDWRVARTRGARIALGEHNGKGEYSLAMWHSERTLDYSEQAYKSANAAHSKSGQDREYSCPLLITADRITRTINAPPNYTNSGKLEAARTDRRKLIGLRPRKNCDPALTLFDLQPSNEHADASGRCSQHLCNARTGVGARVQCLDCLILRSGLLSLRPNLPGYPAKRQSKCLI